MSPRPRFQRRPRPVATEEQDPHAAGVISALELQVRRGGKRINVFLDGRFAFGVDAEVARDLRVGQVMEGVVQEQVLDRDQFQGALDTALAFLGHRPRSAQEIRRRLARKKVSPGLVEEVLDRLRQLRLVDDEAFARYWVEQRQTFRPRGARVLRAELRQRGVDGDLAATVADGTVPSADDDAYRAAARKARQLASLDERTFRTRLRQFLARRGFDWDTVGPTVERLWREARAGEVSRATD